MPQILNLTKRNASIFLALSISIIALLSACQTKEKKEQASAGQNAHKVVVNEVIQVSQYTYLRVTENEEELWLAAPTMDAKTGSVYYYNNGMVMTNFVSKDLGRTFAKITFIERLSTEPIPAANSNNPSANIDPATSQQQAPTQNAQPQKPTIEKAAVDVKPVAGGITISQLFSKKATYENKTVKIRGQVTKVNNGIMNKNWIHMQDGTDYEGYFDLTVTTSADFKTGDVVTFEGKISLKKDFGYGYYYEVIMEDGIAR